MSNMADFEKMSRALEEGGTLDSSTTPSQDSPTLTNSSMPLETQTAQSAESTPPSPIPESELGLWKRLSNVFQGRKAPPAENDSVEDTLPRREIQVRTLQRFDHGYPYLAAFSDSAEEYMMYRRFGYLQSRILLEKQDELRLLEKKLDEIDDRDLKKDPDILFAREYQGVERKGLLTEIEKTFCSYSQLIQAAQNLTAANKPTRSEHKSMLNFLTSDPVDDPESEYVLHKEDLITLRPGRENAWLDRGIEKCLKAMHCSALEYIFGSPESMKKSSDTEIYYCKQKIEMAASIVITTMILFLLIVPIYLLYHLVERTHGLLSPRDTALCIGILLVFTLVFSAVMSFFTRARRHEILGAAAAYCAVLVVFLGNVGNN